MTGFSGTIGMITLYYNMGVVGRKYRNMNHLKLALWFGLIGGGGSVALGNFVKSGHGAAALLLTAASVLVTAAYFIVFPLLLRTYFKDEWVRDAETSETDSSLMEAMARCKFTGRESQVCRLLLEGRTMRQISAALKISQSTVNTHCTAIYRKTGINSRIELIKLLGGNNSAP